MITFPNAKINLGLNIVEKRPDGYHNLETIFYPINLQDALEVTRRENNDKEYTLHISGSPLEGEPEDNLVVKAYKLLKKDYPGLLPVDIHMYKHIPAGAGLGGGSSDAACMIKLLNDKFSLGLSTERMEEYAVKLGADCAFFIRNKPVFATGIGNLFEPVELSYYSEQRTKPRRERNFRILKIGTDVPRAELYGRIDRRVDEMLAEGLEVEARRLYPYKHLNALQTVGYKELFAYFDGRCSRDEAVELIKRNTRRYAKRQLTWFRRDPEIFWTPPGDTDKIIAYIDGTL